MNDGQPYYPPLTHKDEACDNAQCSQHFPNYYTLPTHRMDACVNAQCQEHYSSKDIGMTDQERLEAKIDAVLAILERVETIADSVASQVKPVLDDLMRSPLLKMLGVKSK